MAESTSVAQNAFQTPTGPNCRQSTQASDRIMTIEPPVLKVPSGLTVSILESVPAAPRNTTEKPVALMIVS